MLRLECEAQVGGKETRPSEVNWGHSLTVDIEIYYFISGDPFASTPLDLIPSQLSSTLPCLTILEQRPD